jgi:hypothetical protein
MIPVTQTITGEQGNCFTACLASILELPIREVPNFAKLTNSDEEFFAMVDEWLATRGLKYSSIPIYNRAVPPVGYGTIEGVSPRGGQHACVAYNGVMVFDPHPKDGTGRGLVEPQFWGILEKI